MITRKNNDFIKLIKKRVSREMLQQGIEGKIKVSLDNRLSTAVAQHIVAQQQRVGKVTMVKATSAEERAEQYLATMLLNKKRVEKKHILGTVMEEEIQRYAKIMKLKGVTKRKETDMTLLLEEIRKISPDAVFALGKQ